MCPWLSMVEYKVAEYKVPSSLEFHEKFFPLPGTEILLNFPATLTNLFQSFPHTLYPNNQVLF